MLQGNLVKLGVFVISAEVAEQQKWQNWKKVSTILYKHLVVYLFLQLLPFRATSREIQWR